MKLLREYIPTLMLICALALIPRTASAVVSTISVQGGGSGDFVQFQVDQNPAGTDYTCFVFSRWLDPATYQIGVCLDESLDLFSVSPGDRITRASVLSLPQTAILGYQSEFVPEPSFYFGIYTPTRGIPVELGSNYPRGIGWVRITYLEGTFAVAESAMDYSGQGLIVGTTTVIPESSSLIWISGFVMLQFKRRRVSASLA